MKIVFLHGRIFEFPSSFALRYFLVKMARPQCETPLIRKWIQVIFKCRVKAKAIMPCVGPYFLIIPSFLC